MHDPDTSDPFAPVVEHIAADGVARTLRYRRPFSRQEANLGEVLIDDFAVPAIAWLLGTGHDNPAPSCVVGATAEVALSVQSALRCTAHHRDRVGDRFDRDIARCVEWLIEQSRRHPDGSCCWDHSAWDSAAVVRTLAVASHHREIAAQFEGPLDLTDAVDCGLRWLLLRLKLASSRHASTNLNPAEHAEIGETLAFMVRVDPDRTEAECQRTVGESASAVLRDITSTLLARQSERMIEIDPDDGTATRILTIWWGDYFGTSEVLRYFVALSDAVEAGTVTVPEETATAIRRSVAKCMLLLEHTQVDGLWGAYLDTVATVDAYVQVGARGSRLFASPGVGDLLTTQPRIVFRVLRWMCDPTQRMDDGSVLHTAFLTTFFAQALLNVEAQWEYSAASIAIVYDEMCLLMEMGVSEHRVRLVDALLDRDRAGRDLEVAQAELTHRALVHDHEQWLRTRWILTLVALTGGVALGVGVAVVGGWVATSVKAADVANLLAFAAMLSATVFAVVGLIWTVGRQRPPSDPRPR